jgi:dihydroorotate dehydrogenase electron transfer subunit
MLVLTEKPTQIAQDHFLLHFETGTDRSEPGQFVSIRVSRLHDPLLRRPFSIFDHEGTTISIIVKTVGKGTEILAHHPPGPMDGIGPSGKGFTVPHNAKVLLAGGGVGNSPLFYLSKKLVGKGCDVTYIYGTASRDSIYMAEQFEKHSKRFILTTDDGSKGVKGFATDAVSELLVSERYDMIYACGPRPMLESIVGLSRGTSVEVSVENYFGCGIGLCSGCTIETASGFQRACMDGPVFNGAAINWGSMPD